MTQVQVTRKELSNGLTAVLIATGSFEGMTLSEVVRVFGIPRRTVELHIKTNGFGTWQLPAEFRKELVADNIVGIRGPLPGLVTKEAIESIVRFISTPETDAIYKQLWDVATAVRTGDFIQAGLDVGLTEDDLLTNFEACLNLLKKTRAERDQARGELKKTKGYAVTNVVAHGLKSSDVYSQYPTKSDMLIEETKPYVTDVDKFVPTGILTIGLKRNGLKTKVWTANKAGTPVKVFNADEVHAFMSTYKEETK
jgi:hypothetical protein